MKRYISNYTILGNGEEVINHITSVGDDGKMISIQPFDRELGNTIYVPLPLCVASNGTLTLVKEAFLNATSRVHFKTLLTKTGLMRPNTGDDTTVLALDFNTKTLKQL